MSHCLSPRPGEEDLNEDQQRGVDPARDPPARRGRRGHLPPGPQGGLTQTEPQPPAAPAVGRQ